jgi:hypothetical protein
MQHATATVGKCDYIIAQRLMLVLLSLRRDDAADALIGIHLGLADLVSAKAERQDEPQFAPRRFQIPRRNTPPAKGVQFVFRYRPLQPQD